MFLKRLIKRILTKAPLNPSSYLHCYLSCPSFLGRRPKRSLLGLLLWHTVKRLERNDWSQVAGGRMGWGSMLCWGGLGHNATGVPSPLWTTVILQKPLDELSMPQILSALYSSRLSVRQGTSSKGLGLGDWHRLGGWWRGGEERIVWSQGGGVLGGQRDRGITGLYVQVWASDLLMNWRDSAPLNLLVRVALCSSHPSSLHPSLLPSTSLRPPPPACKPPPVFPGRWAPRRRRPTRD